MESILNQLNAGNLNVQLPVGYMLAAIAVLFGGYVIVKKVVGFCLGIVAKVSFAMLASGVLFIGGLTGTGYSIGTYTSGPPTPRNEKYVFSAADLKKLAENNGSGTNERISYIMEYAKERDKQAAKDNSAVMQYISYDANVTPESYDYRATTALLAFSAGMIICGLAWFTRGVFGKPVKA